MSCLRILNFPFLQVSTEVANMVSTQQTQPPGARARNDISPEDMIPGTEVMREWEEYDVTQLSRDGYV